MWVKSPINQSLLYQGTATKRGTSAPARKPLSKRRVILSVAKNPGAPSCANAARSFSHQPQTLVFPTGRSKQRGPHPHPELRPLLMRPGAPGPSIRTRERTPCRSDCLSRNTPATHGLCIRAWLQPCRNPPKKEGALAPEATPTLPLKAASS